MAKEIHYSSHLIFRLELRKIPYTLPRRIIIESKEKFFDKFTQHKIAVMAVKIKDKLRELSVSYDEKGNRIEVITIHPLRSYQKLSRIKSGRWKRL
jgi:hypothetical protein